MKKIILLIALALLSSLLLAQTQEQPAVESQVQPRVEPQAQPKPQSPDMNLKKINFPEAFIQAGNEYPAGSYWLVLTSKDGLPAFTVHNAKQEMLFEELAVVKARSGNRTGSSFRVQKTFLQDKEFFRVKVITPGQWLAGYFLVKK
jgi:hypothetical protein